MLREVQREHPADPALVEAFRRSVRGMKEGQLEIARLMTAAHRKFGPLPEGAPVKFGSADDAPTLPYLDPDIAERVGQFVDEVGAAAEQHLIQAPTLEAQRDVLLNTMRDMLMCMTFHEVHPKQASAVITTVEELFDAFHADEVALTRPLLDLRHDLHYYAHIAYDSMDAVIGLSRHWQREQGIEEARLLATPGAIAWRQRMQDRPVREGQESFYDTAGIDAEAAEIFRGITEPFHGILPRDMSVDMLGLVMRAADQVAETAIRKSQPYRKHQICNDIAPLESEALLASSEVRAETCRILMPLFQNHPHAGYSADALMQASWQLEELLAAEETQQRGR